MSEKSYNKISESILKEILLLVGKENVSLDKESLISYGHDETENLSFPPEVLVKPKDAALLRYLFCSRTFSYCDGNDWH